ncbi:MAG: hypothetical protein KQI35_03190 [Bacteroidetes bacterium]|nr:hypothetical protein [Bacteroidota bacterium]
MNRSIYIQALQMEKNGDWDGSHRLIQQYHTAEACWIHAYLHRVEGDLGNAGYWYARAGKSMPQYDLNREWQELMESINKE